MEKIKDTQKKVVKNISDIKLKQKRILTVDDIKSALEQLENIKKLIKEINVGNVDLYTKQNTAISAVPLKMTQIPKEIKDDLFQHLNNVLMNKQDALTKIITGE